MKNQRPHSPLTLRALLIGAIGSAVLTASSLFIALKMGMLPWPIAFAAIVSVLALRATGSSDLHEANVCHAAMSAGSMVAGGLAFTIPGLWIMGQGADLTIFEVLICAFAGTVLGLAACAYLQPSFICDLKLAYPIGRSAADTLRAVGDSDAADAPALFWGMGLAGIYAALRDALGLLPGVLFMNTEAITGVVLGIYNSPMMVAMGFSVGLIPALVWFLGACIGHLGIVGLLPVTGLVDAAVAGDIRVSLGLGMMLGVGAGTIIRSFVHTFKERHANAEKDANPSFSRAAHASDTTSTNAEEAPARLQVAWISPALASAGVAALLCVLLQLNPLASIIVCVATWFCVYLASWLTGTTGINPMEIFGMLVLLLIQALFRTTSLKLLFLVAGVVAVGCGICGDVMNDLKAGDELGTEPSAQFWAMVVGGVVGAIVASLLLMGMYRVYGPEAFGAEGLFVSTQASNVAAMAGGISHVPAFVFGLGLGCVLALLGLPVMTLGIGIYLPFVMSTGAGVGALVKLIFDAVYRNADTGVISQKTARMSTAASGILGGESLVGVLMALIALAQLVMG